MRRGLKLGAAALALALAATGCAGQPDDGTMSLTFSDGYSGSHPIGVGGTQPFLEHLQQNGESVGLAFERYAPGQLGKPADMLKLLRSDAVQIAPVFPSYLANSMPLSSVAELPGSSGDACASVDALMTMVRPGGTLYDLEIEEQGIVPIWGVIITGYRVFSADQDVSEPESLRGTLLRSPGGVGDRVIKGLGASPVFVSTGDMYEAISRGTVEGLILPPFSVTAYGIDDVVTRATGDLPLASTTILMSVSREQWDALSEPQKELLLEAGRIAQEGACTSLEDANAKAEQEMQANGIVFEDVDPASIPRWEAALDSARSSWISDLQSVGLPADRVLAEYEGLLAGERGSQTEEKK